MIGKNKNSIIYKTEEMYVLNISRCEIEKYLLEVKNAIQGNRYRIERNSHRQDNINLFLDYVIVVSLHEQKYPIRYYFKQ